MGYSPSPSKGVMPQFSYLDGSVEIGRASTAIRDNAFSRRPDTNTSSGLADRQRRFRSKYPDIKSSPVKNSFAAGYDGNNTTTSSRLFRNVGEVPLGTNFKVQSNMIDKLTKEKKMLELQQREQENLVKNLREKLQKYKSANEGLKNDVSSTKEENDLLQREHDELQLKVDELKNQNERLKASAEALRNKDNTRKENDITEDKISDSAPGPMEGEPQDTLSNPRLETKLDTFLDELKALKELIGQDKLVESTAESTLINEATPLVNEIDLISTESQELRKLKEYVDELKRKLAVREENKLRKYELRQEIAELSSKLESDDIPKAHKSDPVAKTPLKKEKANAVCQTCQKNTCVNSNCTKQKVDVAKWYQ